MPVAHLADRAVISIRGEEAMGFLGGLLTCAVDASPRARYGALLTPQGKIIADFFLCREDATGPGDHGEGQGFWLDVARTVAEVLLKRLSLYKLRAKVAVADVSAKFGVLAGWNVPLPHVTDGVAFPDPRFAPMGWRFVAPADRLAGHADAAAAEYERHRIALAIPQGGRDFGYGDAFPHEAGMDQLGGVDFDKGCYVGQEVVSRMEHRGSARTRIGALSFHGKAPSEAQEIKAGEKIIGRVGSVDAENGRAIAILRLDRLDDARSEKLALRAGDSILHAEKPAWANYAFPKMETDA
ncbi:MAG: folate-binding protein YgfZ [Hyphomicrobiales bacterium]|nr:folate-binding protein YgfZ [Hyphomicrobiales bacterium]